MLEASKWVISLGYVKAALDLRTSDRDFLVKELCGAVTEYLQDYLGYSLVDATYTHDGTTLRRLDGTGRHSLFVRHRPVTAVSAAGIRWENDIDLTDVPDGFCFYPERGELYLGKRVWTAGRQNVSVTYRAGYTTYDGTASAFGITMPGPIRQVALELVSRKEQEIRKGGPQITDIRVGDTGVIFTINEMTKEQAAMLRPYRAAGLQVG